MFMPQAWDPSRPYTWNMARPPAAEVESVRDQIGMAREYSVRAHLHVCHISVPEAVELVDQARKWLDMSCGATPHHLTMFAESMTDGMAVAYKVNPPIREEKLMRRMRQLLKDGRIDFIETDHAPHAPSEKEFNPSKAPNAYMSGIRSLDSYASFIEDLKKDGFSDAQIERVTYSNIKKVFPKILE